MDKSIEEKFVNTFVIKEKRERILYELTSTKKRALATNRLYALLDKHFIVYEGKEIDERALIAEFKKYSKMPQTCYNISESQDDGKFLPFEVAVKNMLKYEMTYVIICDEKTAIASEEYEICGTPAKVILHKN